MFNEAYYIRGKHAEYVRYMVASTDRGPTKAILNYGHQLLVLAPIIGIVENRRGIEVVETDIQPFVIGINQVVKRKEDLKLVFRTMLLTDNRSDELKGKSIEDRVNLAFKTDEEGLVEYLDLFHRYLLGGIEYLYEEIIIKSTTGQDYMENIMDLIIDYSHQNLIAVEDIDF